MFAGLPNYLVITFLAAVALTFQFLMSAARVKRWPVIIMSAWLLVSGALAFGDFFADTSGMPPRFILAVAPPFIFIILLLITKKGQGFLESLDIRMLTLLHVVRIPVELSLYWLAAEKLVPGLMTFEGRNFDVISGLTAPVMYFLCFKNGKIIRRKLLLYWNLLCLALLINIVVNAVLSAPFSFQRFAFDQPNIAVLYFPFVWLPAFIVMVVFLSHLVVIGRLQQKTE
ncbi:MAG: hypothetical protein JNM88_13400 [Chitinophagaceae bacterium]|nr:hypothetical protein [Chitinophagaceae bacterium]